MKKFLTVTAAIALTVTMAQARIGYTQAECAARYGNPTDEELNVFGSSKLTYNPDGFVIKAHFHLGKAYGMYYEPEKPLTLSQVSEILKKNSDTTWMPIGDQNATLATFSTTTTNGHKLDASLYQTKGSVISLSITDIAVEDTVNEQTLNWDIRGL